MIEPLNIDAVFEAFMRKVNPGVDHQSVQYLESRRVFFAGAAAMFYHSTALAAGSEAEGIAELERIDKQLDEFKRRVEERDA